MRLKCFLHKGSAVQHFNQSGLHKCTDMNNARDEMEGFQQSIKAKMYFFSHLLYAFS